MKSEKEFESWFEKQIVQEAFDIYINNKEQ